MNFLIKTFLCSVEWQEEGGDKDISCLLYSSTVPYCFIWALFLIKCLYVLDAYIPCSLFILFIFIKTCSHFLFLSLKLRFSFLFSLHHVRNEIIVNVFIREWFSYFILCTQLSLKILKMSLAHMKIWQMD